MTEKTFSENSLKTTFQEPKGLGSSSKETCMLEADTEGRGGTATAPPIKLGARNNSEMRDKGKKFWRTSKILTITNTMIVIDSLS